MIVADILHRDADVFEYFIQRFSEMAEGYGSVMGEVAFDQYMAVEPAHLRDGKYADGTKGAGMPREVLRREQCKPADGCRRYFAGGRK